MTSPLNLAETSGLSPPKQGKIGSSGPESCSELKKRSVCAQHTSVVAMRASTERRNRAELLRRPKSNPSAWKRLRRGAR